MQRVERENWEALWRGVCDLSDAYPDGIVFIGGIAVYLHSRDAKSPEAWIEFSHDGDFYIDFADYSDLRDREEVTTNRRLSKSQIVIDGIDFDIYVEYNNNLRVTYSDIFTFSSVVEKVRVASLEHLLLLKLDAYAARRRSAKGRKDERDIVRISHILSRRKIRKNALAPYLVERDVELMNSVLRSSEFIELSQNTKHASALRREVEVVLDVLERILK